MSGKEGKKGNWTEGRRRKERHPIKIPILNMLLNVELSSGVYPP